MDLDHTGSMFGPGNFLNLDPPSHDLLRKIVRDSFSARRIMGLERAIRRHASELVDGFRDRGSADFARELATPLPLWVISEILGIPPVDRDEMGRRIHVILHRHAGDPEIPRDAYKAWEELRVYFADLIAERRARPGDDALTAIGLARLEGDALADEVVLGLCVLLYGAGTETVSNFVSNALVVLANHPDARAELFAEPQGIAMAIEELLRFESPVQNIVRTTTRSLEIHGGEVPADSRMLLLLGSANRDERRYDDPDRLDLKRRPKRHFAFGEGIHFCLGAPLARLEARMIFSVLGERIPEYEIVGPVVRVAKVNSRGVESLPVRFLTAY